MPPQARTDPFAETAAPAAKAAAAEETPSPDSLATNPFVTPTKASNPFLDEDPEAAPQASSLHTTPSGALSCAIACALLCCVTMSPSWCGVVSFGASRLCQWHP